MEMEPDVWGVPARKNHTKSADLRIGCPSPTAIASEMAPYLVIGMAVTLHGP